MEAYYSDTCGAVIVHARPFIAGLVKKSMYLWQVYKYIHRVMIIPLIVILYLSIIDSAYST